MSYAEPLLAQLTDFSWAAETTYKTRPTNIDQWLRVAHGDLEIPMPIRETEVIHAHGGGRAPQFVNDYKKWTLDGAFPFEVITGEFLGAIFGKVVTTGSDPYIHTITVLDGMPGSFAIQVPFLQPSTANVIQEYLGCRVSAATFKAGEDSETLMCSPEFMAAKPQDGGASPETVTKSTAPAFHFKQGILNSTAMWAGAKARVHDVEMKVNLNTKANYVSGGEYYPYDILPGKVDFGETKLTIGIEDDTEWDEIIGVPGTIYDYEYEFTRGANDIITFSGTAKLKSVPYAVDEHDIRADMILIPISMQIVVEDSIATYPYE